MLIQILFKHTLIRQKVKGENNKIFPFYLFIKKPIVIAVQSMAYIKLFTIKFVSFCFILPTWVLVTHMFNHQTHHRGQLTTLLSRLGYNPGVTDIPWLPCLNAIVEES